MRGDLLMWMALPAWFCLWLPEQWMRKCDHLVAYDTSVYATEHQCRYFTHMKVQALFTENGGALASLSIQCQEVEAM